MGRCRAGQCAAGTQRGRLPGRVGRRRPQGGYHRLPPGGHLSGTQGRRPALANDLLAGTAHPRRHPSFDRHGPTGKNAETGRRSEAHTGQTPQHPRRAQGPRAAAARLCRRLPPLRAGRAGCGRPRFSSASLAVTPRKSKTDQKGRSGRIGIPYGSSEKSCPVRSLQAWLEATRIVDGAVFRSLDKISRVQPRRLSHKAVARIVKRRAQAVGLDPDRHAGHSLRAGLATSAAAGGASERAIMNQTGHTSTTMVRRYIREANLFAADNAASLAGL
ncbi:MAG: tyrosine-type recombinase/integrase [Chloroflexi bacterium]|nr:tyrosine-type recombinase/integrase [Chloroflexota bacterium]